MTVTFRYQHIQTANEEEFVARGTKLLERATIEAVTKRGHCILGLSGGSTPGPIYAQLGQSKDIDWSKVSLFLVDERYVPKEHAESNQRLIAETLLAHARIPRPNLVFPKTTLAVENCVADYEERLRSLFAEGAPDIVVLGMGEDGHIASLFPNDKAALEEKQCMVLHVQTDRFAICDRITIILPLLASARSMLFLLRGKNKSKIFEETVSAKFDPLRYPAHVLLNTGRTTWLTCW